MSSAASSPLLSSPLCFRVKHLPHSLTDDLLSVFLCHFVREFDSHSLRLGSNLIVVGDLFDHGLFVDVISQSSF